MHGNATRAETFGFASGSASRLTGLAPGCAELLSAARDFAKRGHDDAAKQSYVQLLHRDPTHGDALSELGFLATAGGHRSAARTVYAQLIRHHPERPAGHVNLGNLLLEDGDAANAREHYETALRLDPTCAAAYQGLARVLTDSGDPRAEAYWQAGFADNAVVTQPYRGSGPGRRLLLLVSARGGNVRLQHWIHDRRFAISAVYCEFFDPAQPLPPYDLVVNAIGDAELCRDALAGAQRLVARLTTPVINPPALVARTGRAENAARLAGIPDVIAPATIALPRDALLPADQLRFPLLLRSPGFHTGQHFLHVPHRSALATAIAALPGDEILAIRFLDARGPDGMARKYRVMIIDGALYPLHLAIAADWKVHYFTAAMATQAGYRDEERRFLDDMPAVLGRRAIAALQAIAATLGLDYAGIDFGLAADGSVLLFEANATMAVIPPGPDAIWDYRRRATDDVLLAVERLLARRLRGTHAGLASRPNFARRTRRPGSG